jgi:hypothetical protein
MERASNQATMLHLLLGALGLGSIVGAANLGCGSVVTPGSSGSGTAAGTGGSGGAGGGQVSSSSGVTTGTGGAPACPTPSTNVDVPVPTSGPCSTAYHAVYACFPKPAAPATCASAYTEACVLATYGCGLQSVGDAACGPDPAAPDQCCYTVVGDCPVGRPFLVDGVARLGSLLHGEGWSEALAPDLSALDAATRAALADTWAREALFEHASIASFARFLLQLLSLGAPMELVRDAQRALAEETAHAATCFGLASAYAGAALGPSALDLRGGLDHSLDPREIVITLAREGCIAETVAALQIVQARDAADDPAVKAALGRIAAEEIEHALLAWRTLGWALERGDAALHAAVSTVFAEAARHVGIGPVSALPGDAAAMRAHGCLPPHERRALAAEVLAGVVAPAARALLASTRPGARPLATGAAISPALA